jgi:tryptophan synthase beta chain
MSDEASGVQATIKVNDFHAYPDAQGRFGNFGGVFMPETLMPPLQELTAAYLQLREDPEFIAEFERDLKHYVGRPSPIYHAERLSRETGGAQILLKREDLNHTGAHKINNTIGQALLARRMGKRRIIAETGAGQHGVATATVCARFGLECVVYMGATDIERQKINVYRMKLLGAGGAGGVRFANTQGCTERGHARLGHECRRYLLHHRHRGRPASVSDDGARFQRRGRPRGARADAVASTGLPDVMTACVGGGSNAIGLFHAFLNDAGAPSSAPRRPATGIESGVTPPRCAGGPGRAARQSHLRVVR